MIKKFSATVKEKLRGCLWPQDLCYRKERVKINALIIDLKISVKL